VDADLMRRAREPMLESFDNALKTNQGWMTLVDRAQTEADRIERHVHARERLSAVTAAQVQAAARLYLTAERAVEVTALPEGAAVAKP
jgi:zinc protease